MWKMTLETNSMLQSVVGTKECRGRLSLMALLANRGEHPTSNIGVTGIRGRRRVTMLQKMAKRPRDREVSSRYCEKCRGRISTHVDQPCRAREKTIFVIDRFSLVAHFFILSVTSVFLLFVCCCSWKAGGLRVPRPVPVRHDRHRAEECYS